MIQPFELMVTNEPFEQVYVRVDINSTSDKPPLYTIEQGTSEMFMTLEALKELVQAVKQLEKTTVQWNKKHESRASKSNP